MSGMEGKFPIHPPFRLSAQQPENETSGQPLPDPSGSNSNSNQFANLPRSPVRRLSAPPPANLSLPGVAAMLAGVRPGREATPYSSNDFADRADMVEGGHLEQPRQFPGVQQMLDGEPPPSDLSAVRAGKRRAENDGHVPPYKRLSTDVDGLGDTPSDPEEDAIRHAVWASRNLPLGASRYPPPEGSSSRVDYLHISQAQMDIAAEIERQRQESPTRSGATNDPKIPQGASLVEMFKFLFPETPKEEWRPKASKKIFELLDEFRTKDGELLTLRKTLERIGVPADWMSLTIERVRTLKAKSNVVLPFAKDKLGPASQIDLTEEQIARLQAAIKQAKYGKKNWTVFKDVEGFQGLGEEEARQLYVSLRGRARQDSSARTDEARRFIIGILDRKGLFFSRISPTENKEIVREAAAAGHEVDFYAVTRIKKVEADFRKNVQDSMALGEITVDSAGNIVNSGKLKPFLLKRSKSVERVVKSGAASGPAAESESESESESGKPDSRA